jgi:hypothetical protein
VAGGANYHYAGGVFYQGGPGAYTVCRGPIGARVPLLPPGTCWITWRNRRYWYGYGNWYCHHDDDDEYEVVAAPEGAIVSDLPEGAEKVVIDGKTYWKAGDTYYKAVYSMGGELMYQVVTP